MSLGPHGRQPQHRGWQFPRAMWPLPQPTRTSVLNIEIAPPQPPRFAGKRGEDVVAWLRRVDNYLALVRLDEERAVAYVTLLLKDNARLWWEAEYVARGYQWPETLAELKLLLQNAFARPVWVQRARSE